MRKRKKVVADVQVRVETNLRETGKQLIGTSIIVEAEMHLIVLSHVPVAAGQETMAGGERWKAAADRSHRNLHPRYRRPVRRGRGLGRGRAELLQKDEDKRTDLRQGSECLHSLVGGEKCRGGAAG